MKELIRGQWLKVKKEKGWPGSHPLLPLYLLLRLGSLLWRWGRARVTFRHAQRKGSLVFQHGRLQLRQRGELLIGNQVRFWSTIATTHLEVSSRGRLEIGDHCYINGALVAAHESIRIGKGVYLAPRAHLADSFAFGTPEAELQTAPIWIQDNAWIATRAIILPGVVVGEGAVVGVGALVTKDVPARAIVAGVPARVVRYLDGQERVTKNITNLSADPSKIIAHGV